MQIADHTNVLMYLVRHGQTVLNAQNAFRGNMNPVLDATGRKQAATVAKLLEHVELSHVFCSDKVRATETAEIVAKQNGLPIHKSECLRALNVGDFSGKKRTPESEAALQVYIEDPCTPIPGGESLNDFKSRIDPCLMEAIEIGMKCGTPTLVVAHSSIVRELGSILYKDHKSILVDPGGIVAVYIKNGKLAADPIFRPANTPPGTRSDTIS